MMSRLLPFFLSPGLTCCLFLLLGAFHGCSCQLDGDRPEYNEQVSDFDTVVGILVRDFLALASDPRQSTFVSYDSTPFARMEREAKDRYELLYQVWCRAFL